MLNSFRVKLAILFGLFAVGLTLCGYWLYIAYTNTAPVEKGPLALTDIPVEYIEEQSLTPSLVSVIQSALDRGEINVDEASKQMLYVVYEPAKLDPRYKAASLHPRETDPSIVVNFVAANYSNLSSAIKDLYRGYVNDLTPILQITGVTELDDEGNVIKTETIPAKIRATTEGPVDQTGFPTLGSAEWHRLNRVEKNSECAVFYTDTNIAPNDDKVETADARSVATQCSKSSRIYKSWGWSNKATVILSDIPDSSSKIDVSDLRSHLMKADGTTRIPIFMYNLADGENETFTGVTFTTSYLSDGMYGLRPTALPLTRLIFIYANNVRRRQPNMAAGVDFEMRSTSAHETAHLYEDTMTALWEHYSILPSMPIDNHEAFVEWCAATTTTPPLANNITTSFEQENDFFRRDLIYPLSDYTKGTNTRTLSQYNLFSFYDFVVERFNREVAFDLRHDVDPLQRLTNHMQGTSNSKRDQLAVFWKDFVDKSFMSSDTNANMNDPKIFWLDGNGNPINPNRAASLVEHGSYLQRVKNEAIDYVVIPKKDLRSDVQISFSPTGTGYLGYGYVTLFEQSSNTSKLRKLEDKSMATNGSLNTTLEPANSGNYLVVLSNAAQTDTMSVNLSLTPKIYSLEPTKKISIYSYIDTSPFGDGVSITSDRLAKSNGFHYVVRGKGANNSSFSKKVSTNSKGIVDVTVPDIGSYEVTFDSYSGSDPLLFTESNFNPKTRTLSVSNADTNPFVEFSFRNRPTLALASFRDANGNHKKDSGEHLTSGLPRGSKIEYSIQRSDCSGSANFKDYKDLSFNGTDTSKLNIPLGKYKVRQVFSYAPRYTGTKIDWYDAGIYDSRGVASSVISDFCNVNSAPAKKTFYFANIPNPKLTVSFYEVTSTKSTLMKGNICSITVRIKAADGRMSTLATLTPGSNGRVTYALAMQQDVELRPGCDISSRLSPAGGDQKYAFGMGDKTFRFNFHDTSTSLF